MTRIGILFVIWSDGSSDFPLLFWLLNECVWFSRLYVQWLPDKEGPTPVYDLPTNTGVGAADGGARNRRIFQRHGL